MGFGDRIVKTACRAGMAGGAHGPAGIAGSHGPADQGETFVPDFLENPDEGLALFSTGDAGRRRSAGDHTRKR